MSGQGLKILFLLLLLQNSPLFPQFREMDPRGPAATAGLRGPSLKRRKSGFVVFEFEDRSTADLIVGVTQLL